MPFNPINPESQLVVPPDAQETDIDTFHISSFLISVDPNDGYAIQLNVRWSEGYMYSGTYVAVNNKSALISGEIVYDAVNVVVTEGNTRYDEIKEALWTVLSDAGEVSDGYVV
jgi:hypothetical protein